jgi:hypothetical protein
MVNNIWLEKQNEQTKRIISKETARGFKRVLHGRVSSIK